MPARTASRIIVALDGPASSGKSSVGAAAAARLGLRFVDTGLIYRALTALALREGIATDDAAALVPLAARMELGDDGTGRLTRVLLDGTDATDSIHNAAVDASVSAVAKVPEVRAALLQYQRDLVADGGIVVAGRDIGTVVLPDAGLKIFLDASVGERARRRILERGLDPDGEEAEIVRAALRARDAQDRGREVAPLVAAEDALHILTDGHSFEQSVDLVADAIRAADPVTWPPAPAPAAPAPTPAAETAPRPKAGPPADPPAKRNRIIEQAMLLDNKRSALIRGSAMVCRFVCRALADTRIEGLENVPKRGPVLLAINHISNLDPFYAGAFVNESIGRRRIHWMGKRELFDWPVFGWICAHGGVHPVERGAADVEAFRLATRILELGYVLLVFPEGTRSPTGELQEAKDGLAMLAMRTGAQIVPIGVNNTDAIWPKGRKLPSPFPRRTVVVRVGKPFRVADVVPVGTDRRTAKTLATTAIMSRIAELLDPRHRGFYAGTIQTDATPEP
jgi:cytidylate kinase